MITDGDRNCGWCFWDNSQRIDKGIGSKSTNRDHPDYSIIKIGQNTEKGPGDLLSLKLQRKTNSFSPSEKLSE